jgi:hypothetical protein
MGEGACPAHTSAVHALDEQTGVSHRESAVIGIDGLGRLVDPGPYLRRPAGACELPLLDAQLDAMLRGR